MNIKLLVAAHKPYPMPKDPMYLPIQAGREISKILLPYAGDNTGSHISAKNPNYCELTAIYWAYQNLDADYIGLAHYRRHFAGTVHGRPAPWTKDKFPYILTRTEAAALLKTTDILLPKPRNYYIESNYSHYIHAHNREGLDLAGRLLKKDPAYHQAFVTVMNRKKAHMFNMFLMKRDIFQDYCSWLFPLLFEIEGRLDLSSYTPYEARVFGFISELMLDVYLLANRLDFQEVPVLFMETEHWISKGGAFLKRKFLPSSAIHR